MLLLIIFLTLLIIQSCKTTTIYRLPADEALPYLDAGNIQATAADLLFLHYYWKLWANDSRYIVGEITVKERDKKRAQILKEIESLNPPD